MTKSISTNQIDSPNIPTYQAAALLNPFVHFGFVGGVATGKTFIGSHWAIKMLVENPGKTGLIAANIYDQLSTATLKEFIQWLDYYNFDYVIDCLPPKEWQVKKRFKSYSNVISVRLVIDNVQYVSHIFTRVLSEPANLRGITITWAWFDELAFAPEEAHNVILSRLRESKGFIKTLATTTTNGENWFYKRYILNKSKLYRTMHVPTFKSVEAGIITQDYYDSLLASYSENKARQELFAEYINALEGRAYYSSSDLNHSQLCPWTQSEYPDPEYPIIVGCDFNFSPAPMVWTILQISPDDDQIHVFEELSQVECSTYEMANRLGARYDSSFLRIFGDASGERGTTSNAGKSDFDQIAETLSKLGITFTIDTDQANPRVKDRVENVNRLLKNGLGVVTLTYNKNRCPLLHEDMKNVGWKQNGKLDDLGNKQLTHSSDGLGYALMKLFPQNRSTNTPTSMRSKMRPE